MSEEIQALLHQYKLQLDPNINYNLDSMFQKTSGWGAKGEMKRIHKTLIPVQPHLARMLHDGEEVLYCARGVQFKFSEQYFLGIWAHLINQTVFVLTNLRLLMFHVNSSGSPRNVSWLIYYNQIKKFKGSMLGNVALDLHDGTKLRFTGFKGADRKRMPACFEEAMQSYQELGFNPEASQSRENLCGRCLAVVPVNQYQCGACQQEFWSPKSVAMRSLVFPSWGDFTLGHTGLAIVELLGYMMTWIVFVGLILTTAAADGMSGGIFMGVLFVFALIFQHCVDAGLTYFIAKKGLHPKGSVN